MYIDGVKQNPRTFCVLYKAERACDYGFACGKDFAIIEADNLEQAIRQVMTDLEDRGFCFNTESKGSYLTVDNEEGLKKVYIYEINSIPNITIDINDLIEENKKIKENVRKSKLKEQELAELKRLKAKYEK